MLSYEPVDITHVVPVKRDYGKQSGSGAGLTKTPAPTADRATDSAPPMSPRQSPEANLVR